MVVVTIIIVSLLSILPIYARRTRLPGNLNKFEKIQMNDDLILYCQFNKMGWQQWHDEIPFGALDLYTKVLYADNFPPAVIAEMVAEGWTEAWIPDTDFRYDGYSRYMPVELLHIVYLSHTGEE